MSLPTRKPLTRLGFLRFEFTTGIPTATRILRSHLSLSATLKVLARTVWRTATTRPLASLPAGQLPAHKDWMTRRQLAQAVLLSDCLSAEGIPQDEVLRITQDVVATVGARFVGANADFVLGDWSAATASERMAFAKQAMNRFPNVTEATVVATETTMDVTFSYCGLAEGARAIGRPELARLFCSADAAFYNGDPSRPILTRPNTIADGSHTCQFKFHWADSPSDSVTGKSKGMD